MGKGKQGCQGEAIALSREEIHELVSSGQVKEAVAALRGDDIEEVFRWTSRMISGDADALTASRYRHLMASLMFEQDDPRLMDDALWLLRRDLTSRSTPAEFKKLAQAKIEAACPYRPRVKGHGDDIDQVRAVRRAVWSVSLMSSDRFLEGRMLEKAFGEDVYIHDGLYPSDERDLLGWGSSTGIGYAFHPGPLIKAVDEGKVFAMPSGSRFTPGLVSKIEGLLESGEIEDPGGRLHRAHEDFMLIVIASPEDADYPTERSLDFRDWQET